MNGAKWKRNEKDIDGKGNGPINGGPKVGRTSSANTNVSTFVNGSLGKSSDHQRPTTSPISKSVNMEGSQVNEKHQIMLLDNSEEPLDSFCYVYYILGDVF